MTIYDTKTSNHVLKPRALQMKLLNEIDSV